MPGQTIENNGWHLIPDGVNGIPWTPDGGIPDDWTTLFGRIFEDGSFDPKIVNFDRFYESRAVIDFAKQHGFEDRLGEHLHQTICIDMDLDCYLVEWHISFPSNAERVAWFLTTDHEKNLQGWY